MSIITELEDLGFGYIYFYGKDKFPESRDRNILHLPVHSPSSALADAKTI